MRQIKFYKKFLKHIFYPADFSLHEKWLHGPLKKADDSRDEYFKIPDGTYFYFFMPCFICGQ
mgnify:CR=1 FL=1